MLFNDTNVLLGVTGSISAYKSAFLARQLIKEGAQVQVIMTESAAKFVAPLTFNTLTGNDVYRSMFDDDNAGTRHIDLGKWADAILIAPATANIIAKTAGGIADDLLSCLILAFEERKIAFAPAMNVHMYNNSVTQKNIKALRNLGYYFIEPGAGELACGDEGAGRLPEISLITEHLHRFIHGHSTLKNKKVVVTAGPTREYLDSVRYITNRSTGKMGYALANEAAKEGASVVLISGPTNLEAPPEVELIRVESAAEMQNKLIKQTGSTDYLFMAAAVEDIAPANRAKKKIKKEGLKNHLAITRNPDLVKNFRDRDKEACIVGFSVEMEEGMRRSIEKMKTKGLDFIVWNDPAQEGAGFAVDTNEVTLFTKGGDKYKFSRAAKRKIAEQIITKVVQQNE